MSVFHRGLTPAGEPARSGDLGSAPDVVRTRGLTPAVEAAVSGDSSPDGPPPDGVAGTASDSPVIGRRAFLALGGGIAGAALLRPPTPLGAPGTARTPATATGEGAATGTTAPGAPVGTSAAAQPAGAAAGAASAASGGAVTGAATGTAAGATAEGAAAGTGLPAGATGTETAGVSNTGMTAASAGASVEGTGVAGTAGTAGASAGSAGMTGAGTAVADGITGAGATGVGMRGAAPIARLTVGTALPLAPRIHTRQEWRAQPPRRRAQVVHHGPDRIVVHHTATANVSDTGLDAAFRLSQAIQRYHMSRNGWDDIGQQFTVSRGGYVMEGRNGTLTAIARGEHVIGAHTANHNDHTLGIETEGTYMRELPPHRQIVALTRLAAWLCGVYGLDPTVAIIGHRDLNPTSCPGDSLYAYLPELRRRVVRRMAQFQDPTQAAALAARAAQAAPPVPFERRPPRRLALPGRGDFLGSGVPFEHGPALGRHDVTD